MKSFLIKLAASTFMLSALAYQVDLRRAFVRLGSIGLGTIATCLCLSVLQFAALAYRWKLVNRMLAMPLPFAEVLRCTLASFCREMRGFGQEWFSYADELGLNLAVAG
jgi:hypothetical protein